MKISLKKVFNLYVFAFAFLFAARPLSDGDFWWHLKTGEYIVRNHLIPRTDIYSFTMRGRPWVAHEWLSEVIFYLFYSWFGFNALIFIFALLTALAFWILFKRSHSHPFIAGFSMLLGVASVLTTIGVRPRVFTLLFASVYIALLSRHQEKPRKPFIWLLVPIMAVWVNLHAGYLIGIVLIALTLAGIFLNGMSDGESMSKIWPNLNPLVLVLLATLAAVNLNPQGPRIFLFPFEFFFSPVQQNTVIDWLSPNFHQPEMVPLELLILLTTAAIALSPRRVRPGELLLFLSTLYATLKSNRHVAIFALVAVPLLGDYLQSYIESTSLKSSFSRGGLLVRIRPLVVALLLLPLVIFAFRVRTQIFSSPLQEKVQVPLGAVDYMKANRITGNTFTDPNIWSGYLIWAMPSNPVYIDGRIDMYGDDFVKQYVNITSGLADWQSPLDHYRVLNVIVSQHSVLKIQLEKSSAWKPVYEDEMAVVFTRR